MKKTPIEFDPLNPFGPPEVVETLKDGVIIHEYEATAFINPNDREESIDIQNKKNPFLRSTEKFLKESNLKTPIVIRITNITNELVENIYRHRILPTENITVRESASLQKNGNQITIETTNTIKPDDAKVLKEKVEHVNDLLENKGLEGIKKERQEELHRGTINSRGGGNLGQYEIIRKTKNPIELKTEKQEDGNLRLTVKVNFNLTENDYYTEAELEENKLKKMLKDAKNKEEANRKFHAAVSNVYKQTQEAVLE